MDEREAEELLRRQGLTPERTGEADWRQAIRDVQEWDLEKRVPPLVPVGRLVRSARSPRPSSTSVSVAEPEYGCAVCQDTRAVTTQRREVNGRTYGAVAVACPACVPLEVIAQGAGIDERFQHARLDTLIVREGNAAAVAIARAWQGDTSVVIASRANPGDALYGNGKTHIACAMLIEQMRRARPARFLSAPMYFDRLHRLMDAEHGSPQAFAEYVANEPLLCFDDLGKEHLTDWSRAQVFALIDARYRKRLPTIITTNVAYDDIVYALGGATADRLNEATWVFVGGPSFRGPQ